LGEWIGGSLEEWKKQKTNNTKDYVTNKHVAGMEGVRILVALLYTRFCAQLWEATEQNMKKGVRK